MTSLECSPGGVASGTTAEINLTVGGTVQCTFTNTKRGEIIVMNETNPADSPEVFPFSLTGGPGAMSLVNMATPYHSALLPPSPDNYYVSQTLTGEWDPEGVICESVLGTSTFAAIGGGRASMGSSIDLAAGDTVTCTFISTQRGHIITDKETLPTANTQSFEFTLIGGPDVINQAFFLADATPPEDSGPLKAGSYNLAELAEAGWDLTGLSCAAVDHLGQPGGASTFVESLSSGQVDIDLAQGDTVTCDFTNVKRAHIYVDKVTQPSADPNSFDFSLSGGPDGLTQSFALTDADLDPHDSGPIKPGSYAVAEIVPEGWDQQSADCGVGISRDNIILAPGDEVTCIFTNVKRGSITVVKDSLPNDVQNFDFVLDGNGSSSPFTLDDDAGLKGKDTNPKEYTDTKTFSNLIPGSYSLSEYSDSIAGWGLQSLSCASNLGSPATPAGSIVVIDLTPGDDGAFGFTTTGGGELPASFDLTTNGGTASSSFSGLFPGSYNVVESAMLPEWDLTGLTCSDPDGGTTADPNTGMASIDLDPGEIVTCDFENTKRGHVVIVKEVDSSNPASHTLPFSFNPSYGAGFELLDTQSND